MRVRGGTRCALGLIAVLAGAAAGGADVPADPSGPASAPAELKDSEAQFKESLAAFCAIVAKTPEAAPVPVALGGWAPLQTPACAITGLVLLGEGNTLTSGPYAAHLAKLEKFVLLSSQALLAQDGSHDCWALSFAIVFLAEVYRVHPTADLREHLSLLVKRLESGQEGEKGWRHSLKPQKDEKYGSFNGVTVWCAAALALAKEQGIAVDEAKLATAIAGLRKSIGKFGGTNYYSYAPTTVGPGRSAAVCWVLKRFAETPGAEAERALGFFLRNAAYAHEGHGSQVMNFAWAALAASVSGPEASANYWKEEAKVLLGERQKDGTFLHHAWRDFGYQDSAGTGKPIERTDNTTWPDKMYGDAWANAWMLFTWQAGLGRSVLAKKLPPPAAPKDDAQKSAQDEAWKTAAAEAEAQIQAGKSAEAAKQLDALLKDRPGVAELHRLRALAYIPALAQKPGAILLKELADGKNGWGAANEAAALGCLNRALSAKEGKGLVPDAFDAGVQLLIARIHGRRLIVSATSAPASPAWVPLYNTFVRSIDAPMKNAATQIEASLVAQGVLHFLPKKTTPAGR
ncbi:MAG: hypothetical protein KIS92_24615 [Planctomycetota bacterium]|nr:hypothetical protein [Planctomycetota bacterium]